MFDRIKKAFAREAKSPAPSSMLDAASLAPVSEWAMAQGFTFSGPGDGAGFAVQGRVAGKPWRMEVGKPSRKYIAGDELRARAELGLNPDISLMVINRALKESLERQAYADYTDSLQTSVDSSMPEEVRWLAMYEEMGWESIPRAFWTRYALVGDDRSNGMAWLDSELARLLMEWPAPAPGADVPFMLMLLRGKAYLRMQQGAAQVPTLQHAAQVFTSACETAVGAFAAPR